MPIDECTFGVPLLHGAFRVPFNLIAQPDLDTPGVLLLVWLDPEHNPHSARVPVTRARRSLPSVLRVLLRGGWEGHFRSRADRAALRQYLLAVASNQREVA